MAKQFSEDLPIVVMTVVAKNAEFRILHLQLKVELLEFITCVVLLLAMTDDIAVWTWV